MNNLKNNSRKILLLVVILSVASIAGYVAFFTILKIKNNKISEKSNLIDFELAKKEKSKSVKKNLSDTEILRSQLDDYIIAKEKIDIFLEEIENLGEESGAQVILSSVNEVEYLVGKQKVKYLSIILDAEGKWADVYVLLGLLENIPKKIIIKNVFLSVLSIKEETWKGKFEFKIPIIN